MRKVVLYIALSLDGYIADANGKVDWLHGDSPDADMPDTYSEFIAEVDTVVMGWNTYNQIVTELSSDEWAYDGLQTFVTTHRTVADKTGIAFTDSKPAVLVRQLQKKAGKSIWICGGADIANQLMTADLIDTYHITIIPTLLGDGIKLFEPKSNRMNLTLIKERNFNSMVELVYERNRANKKVL